MQMGFLGFLQLLFITLKLLDLINWSWWWVMSPMLLILIIGVVVVAMSAMEKK